MKKLVTILLVLALVLGMSSVAFGAGFSDTKDLAKSTQSSIAKLTGLKIVNGYPDGTFKPANNITRAEFAKIAISLAGMESSAEVLKNTASQFSDVTTGMWYTGWVNLAASQGYVKGFPDGTFKPNATITYGEVITVLMRVLGYNDNLPGPWPVDYIAKAGALGITDGISFSANAPCTRADMAKMADNTLDTAIVEWDAEKAQFVVQTHDIGDGDEDLTLLEDKFDSLVNEDVLISDAKFDDGAWYIQVDGMDDSDFDGWIELSENNMVSDGSLPTAFGPTYADILFNDDDEVVEYIEVTSTTVKAAGDDYDATDVTYDGIDDEFGGEVEILDVTYDVTPDLKFIELNADEDGYVAAATDTFELNDDHVYTAFINSDDEVYQIKAAKPTTPAIVDTYKATTGKLTYLVRGNYNTDTLDLNDDDVLIEKGGAFVTPEDLENGDVIYVDKGWYGYDYYIDVRDMTATGKVQAYKDATIDQIKIEGTWYDVAEVNALSRNGEDYDDEITKADMEDFYGETVTFFQNKAWQVCFVNGSVDSSDSNNIYGAVTKLTIDYPDNQVTKIKVMKKDGTEATYVVSTDDVEMYNDTADLDQLRVDDLIKFSVNADNQIDSLTLLAEGYRATPSYVQAPYNENAGDYDDYDYLDVENLQYFGTIADGNTDTNRIAFTKSFDDEGGAIDPVTSWYTVSSETVIFNVYPTTASPIDDDSEAEMVSRDDLVDWADVTGGTAYVQFDGNQIDYIFIADAIEGAASDSYAAILDAYTGAGDDPYVDVDVKGDKKVELENTGEASADAGMIYTYSINATEFDAKDLIFDAESFDTAVVGDFGSVAGDVYSTVTNDGTEDSVEIDGVNYFTDEDTIVYDFSDYYDDGSDPVYMSTLDGVYEDDLVVGLIDSDDDDILDLLIIVNNVDTYNF